MEPGLYITYFKNYLEVRFKFECEIITSYECGQIRSSRVTHQKPQEDRTGTEDGKGANFPGCMILWICSTVAKYGSGTDGLHHECFAHRDTFVKI